jgi:hypothetical protein
MKISVALVELILTTDSADGGRSRPARKTDSTQATKIYPPRDMDGSMPGFTGNERVYRKANTGPTKERLTKIIRR